MNIGESLEALEESHMSPYVFFSNRTRGRDKPEPLCDMRPEYQRGRDRILHSKVFQYLEHKTQVFLTPEGDHCKTRLTYTLEAFQIACTIARILRLNENLTGAITLSHNLGHTPSGHSDECILNKICEDGFAHYQQSVRIVEILGKDGRGLSLTWEVRDGVLNHRASSHPFILGGVAVRLSSKIAYINHDIDDAIRVRMFVGDGPPGEHTDILGHGIRERPNGIMHDIILNSMDKPVIIMSESMEEAVQGPRRWMLENVHKNEILKAEEGKTRNTTRQFYEYYMGRVDELPMGYVLLIVNGGKKKSRVVCDYVASMSDIYAIDQSGELFVPKWWDVYWVYKYRGEIISCTIPVKL